MKYKFLFLISIFILVNACQAVQDGLAGNKNKNSDEFLIEKKNPLEIPPDFGALPKPNKKNNSTNKAETIDQDIEKLFQKKSTIENSKSKDKSAEDFVLKKIKNN